MRLILLVLLILGTLGAPGLDATSVGITPNLIFPPEFVSDPNNLDLSETDASSSVVTSDLVELLFPPSGGNGEDDERTDKMRVKLSNKLGQLLDEGDPKVDLRGIAARLAKMYMKEMGYEGGGGEELTSESGEISDEVNPESIPMDLKPIRGHLGPEKRVKREEPLPTVGHDPFLLFYLTEEKIKTLRKILAKRHLYRKRHANHNATQAS